MISSTFAEVPGKGKLQLSIKVQRKLEESSRSATYFFVRLREFDNNFAFSECCAVRVSYLVLLLRILFL